MTDKFDPVKEFVSLRDNLSKTVGQGLKNVTGAVVPFPAVDIYETEDAVIVQTESLPGLDVSSLEISMEEDILTLKGETQSASVIPDDAYLHRELRYGEFKRDVRIPRQVKADKASAAFKHNILTITLPKQLQAKGQIIDVTPAE